MSERETETHKPPKGCGHVNFAAWILGKAYSICDMVTGTVGLPTFNMGEGGGREVLDLLLDDEAQGGQHGDAAMGDLRLTPAPDFVRAACAAQEVQRIKDVCNT